MALYKLEFGGALYSDIWSCTLHMDGNFQSDNIWNPTGRLPGQSTVMEDCADDVKKWFETGEFTGNCDLRYVKMNEIDEHTRKYVDQNASHEILWDTPIKSGGSFNIPPQLSVCVSLRTDRKRGVGAFGRFYPPPYRYLTSVGNDGHLQKDVADVVLQHNKQLISNLNNHPGIDNPATNGGNVIVLGKDGSKTKVTRVAIGDVVDTQRRRRGAIKERYVFAGV